MDNGTAIYPGRFNPWHDGHEDVLQKALKIFDKVIVFQFYEKNSAHVKDRTFMTLPERYTNVEARCFSGLLVDTIKDIEAHAIIRGLRNGHDLEYEATIQYWNEDLGITIPTIYFLTDRKYTHISSSTIRQLDYIRIDNTVREIEF